MARSRLVAATLTLSFGCAVTIGAVAALPDTVGAAADQLHVNFDQGESLAAGTTVSDVSGHNNDGVVKSMYGGTITPMSGAADFPNPCWSEPCPNVMIEILDNASLDPGTAAFEFGADIKMKSDETADGENVLQKGRWGETGGQWKLQVDKAGGKPSCVISGFRNGVESRVVLKASIGIADNVWHTVVCRRASSTVQILIDGVARGSASMPSVNLASSAAVTIGAKEVAAKDNDQFQARLDDVFMRLI